MDATNRTFLSVCAAVLSASVAALIVWGVCRARSESRGRAIPQTEDSSIHAGARTPEAATRKDEDSEPTLPEGVFERIWALADPGLPVTIRDKWLAENNSSLDHWDRMMRMGRKMIALNYDVTRQRLPYFVAGGASHIVAPDAYPYKSEWRLAGIGGERPNDVPVSFLNTSYDGPFTHEMAVATVKEFRRISQGDIDTDKVTVAMKQAETRFTRARREKPNRYGFLWTAASDVPPGEWPRGPGDHYAIRVAIQEWAPEEYTREEGASEIFVYFVHLPPNREVDLLKVNSGSFRSWD